MLQYQTYIGTQSTYLPVPHLQDQDTFHEVPRVIPPHPISEELVNLRLFYEDALRDLLFREI